MCTSVYFDVCQPESNNGSGGSIDDVGVCLLFGMVGRIMDVELLLSGS
jgi:hypothetical protein